MSSLSFTPKDVFVPHRLMLVACVLSLMLMACHTPSPSPDGGSIGGGGGGGSGNGTGGGQDGNSAVGWYKDVQPLIRQHCVSCHTSDGIAPFALDTYAQASLNAPAMAASAAARQMPPWMPSDTCGGPFVGNRRLKQTEIDTLVSWAANGAPEGNSADAPLAADAGMPGLPRVDQTVTMVDAYTPASGRTDDYRCFAVNPQLTSPRQVVAYDIQPGVRTEVHHVIVYVVDLAQAQAADAAEAGPGWTCFGGADIPVSGVIGAWAPGTPALFYPAGTGITVEAGKGLVMQVHYNTAAGVRTPDRTSIELMYADSPVVSAHMIELVASGFTIPAGSTNYTFSKTFQNPLHQNIKVYGYFPHMHALGRRITLSGPFNQCLIEIPYWDFHWQQQYFSTAPALVGPNESITLECAWDNPSSTPVRWGEKTTDEMCFAFLYATL